MRIVKTIALAFGLALVTVNFAWADWSGAAADQYISLVDSIYPGAYKVYCPSLAAAPNGDLYTIWAQGGTLDPPYEVFFSKSTDDGVTWSGTSADQMISANDGDKVYNGGIFGARRTDIAVDSQGRIYVVWPEDYMSYPSFDTTIEIMMVMSTDGGTTWIHSDTDFPIGDTLSDPLANSPNIGIDANDNIFVVWNQTNPVSGAAEIALSVSTDNGATWSGRATDRFISYSNALSSSAPDIAIESNGTIHVVWREYVVSGDYRLLYGKSTDGGATFSSETQDIPISYAPYSIVFPRIAVGPTAGFIHTIYAQNDTAMYVGSTDCGSTWNETEIYGGSSYDMYGPDIGVTSNGTLIAILDEQYPGTANRQVYASYSFDNGATWSVTLDLASNFDPVPTFDRIYIPTLAITDDDVLHVTYATNIRPSSNSYQEMCYTMNDSLGVLQGIITGIVTELDEVTPIESVEVVVYDSEMNPVAYDMTNAAGNYVFPLDPGIYSLTFSIYTHHDTTVTDVEAIENTETIVDVSLAPMIQGTISGTVYEETGTYPLAGVYVYATNGILSDEDYTDALGNYGLTLFPDTYDVEFSVELFEDTTVTGVVVDEGEAEILNVNMTWAIPADDIEVVSLDEPTSFMIVDGVYAPALTLINNGYQDQTFDLNLVIGDENRTELYNETYTGAAIDSLDSGQIVFPVTFSPTATGDYTFTAVVINTGDQESSNDTLELVIPAYEHEGSGGPDGFGYVYKDNTAPCGPVFNWIDISGTGTQIEPTLHYFMSDELPLGFNFPFYGNTYTSMWVNSHGSVHVGVCSEWSMTNDCPVPDPSPPNAPMMMVIWDGKEVHYEIGQGVYYQYFDEDIDYMVVQWNASTYQEDDTLEFEVIFYENGNILYQYNEVSENLPNGQGQEATIGLEFDIVPDLYGISYLCDDDNPGNRLVDRLAIKWNEEDILTGCIAGTVTDTSTGEPIEGALVAISGRRSVAYSNDLGEYILDDLSAGTYSVNFSHVDYDDKTVTGIEVTAGNETELNVTLMSAGFAYLPGDVNMALGIWPPQCIGGDVTYLVGYFIGGGQAACMLDGFWCSADINGDCTIIGGDVTALVGYFVAGGSLVPCPDYEPLWPPLPDTAPDGWPNCDTPVINSKIIPTGSVK